MLTENKPLQTLYKQRVCTRNSRDVLYPGKCTEEPAHETPIQMAKLDHSIDFNSSTRCALQVAQPPDAGSLAAQLDFYFRSCILIVEMLHETNHRGTAQQSG